MAFYRGPKIVTNGLILALDAANTKSYVSGSTTWRDLSGNGRNATLTNGPSFNSENGGSIVFDGIDDYATFSSVTAQTICFWGRLDPTIVGLAGLVCNSVTGDNSLRTEGGTFRAAAPNAPNSADFQLNYVSSFMINGQSNLSTNASGYFIVPGGRTLTQDFYLGALGGGMSVSTLSHTFNGRLYKGRIYAVYIYNRRLSNDELLQNYNALKSRFNLT
jgi:hypothetical protein